MTETEISANRWVVLKSAWHWDFWVATLLGVASLITLVFVDSELAWGIATPCMVTSFGVLTVAWRQSTALSQRLKDSHYGELVRKADSSEVELSAPFNVVKWVSVISVICAAITAVILAMTTARYLHISLTAAMFWLSAWSILGLVSLLRLDAEHNRNIAFVQSQQEKLDLAQRQYTKESGGTLRNT